MLAAYIYDFFGVSAWFIGFLCTLFRSYTIAAAHKILIMDIFDYRASHRVNTEGVFVASGSDTEIGGLFLRLKNVMTTELHLRWDLAFLQQYIIEKMVPRSLRWEVQPQQGETDLESWFNYFNDTGISFLNLLISKKNNKLLGLDREIKELKDKLSAHKNTMEYNTLSSNLQSHLEKEDRDQKHKKQRKYSRDVGDYRANAVFGWQKLLSTSSPMEGVTNTAEGNIPMGAPSNGNIPIGASSVITTISQPNPKTSAPRGRNTLRGRDRHDDVPHLSQQRVYYDNPQTPRNPQRGRGNQRGNMRGRGNPRSNTHPQNYNYNNQSYQSPARRQETRSDFYHRDNLHYRYPSPVPTYNRYTPLRDEYSPERRRENLDHPVYTHTTNHYNNQGFHEDRRARKRGPDQREAAEGGGNYKGEKRKRT